MIRGAMPAIHRYLPLTVNPDAREWLATGLPAGEMRSAAITLKGDLDDFTARRARRENSSSRASTPARPWTMPRAAAAQGLAHAREPVRQLPHRQGQPDAGHGGRRAHASGAGSDAVAGRDQRRHSEHGTQFRVAGDRQQLRARARLSGAGGQLAAGQTARRRAGRGPGHGRLAHADQADGAAAQYRRHAGGRPYPVRRQQLLLHAGNAAVDADARRPGVFREGRADPRGPRPVPGRTREDLRTAGAKR